MTHMEIDRLLSCTVDELIALVEPMSADNCEQYARTILGLIGGPSFEQVMTRIVETAVPKDGDRPPTNSDAYYFAVCDLFPMSDKTMTSWAGSFFSLHIWPHCGSKNTTFQARTEPFSRNRWHLCRFLVLRERGSVDVPGGVRFEE
jgi:hypothetical protein